VVVYIFNPTYSGRGRRVMSSKLAWAKVARLYLKNKIFRKVGRNGAVVPEALSSVPSATNLPLKINRKYAESSQ
jgi:hypothetical protein